MIKYFLYLLKSLFRSKCKPYKTEQSLHTQVRISHMFEIIFLIYTLFLAGESLCSSKLCRILITICGKLTRTKIYIEYMFLCLQKKDMMRMHFSFVYIDITILVYFVICILQTTLISQSSALLRIIY